MRTAAASSPIQSRQKDASAAIASSEVLDDFDSLLTELPQSEAPNALAPTTDSQPHVALARPHRATGAPEHADTVSASTLQTAEASPDLQDFVDNWDLYADPVLTGTFAGLALGFAGVFIVLRRAVFVTAAISQAAALGVACGFLLAIETGIEAPPVLIAFGFAVLAALALAFPAPSGLPREAPIGFVYLTCSALALIVGSSISQEAHDIGALLYGSAVLVRHVDFISVIVLSSVVIVSLLMLTRGLAFAGFDPDAARVQGLPVRLLETTLWLLVAAEVAVTTRALGALPVFAFAVLPAFGALRLARRLPHALALAATMGAVSGAAGYLLAFLLQWPVGAAQAAVAASIAIAAVTVSRRS